METLKTFEIFKTSSKDCLEWSNKDWKALSGNALNIVHLSEKVFAAKIWKIPFSNSQNIRFRAPGSFQNRFIRSFLWPNFDFNSFERFASLFQKKPKLPSKPFSKMLPFFKDFWTLCLTFSKKTVSTLPLKNLQKTEKCHFSRFTIFVFGLKVASKPFSKILYMNNFEFKKFWFFALLSPLASLGCWKICKKLKNGILKRSGDWVASKASF